MKESPVMTEADQAIARVLDSGHVQPPTTPWGIRNVLWVAGFDVIRRWEPIRTAPIPPPEGLPSYWSFPCLIQNEGGTVFEGYAAYVGNYLKKGGKPPLLRWYDQSRRVVSHPKYWMPLPAPKND